MRIRGIFKNLAIKLGYYVKPKFFILGAQKAGTTNLYSYLKLHPQIVEPGWKEIHYFDLEKNYERGVKWYFKHFFLPHKFFGNKVTFEATPDYMFYSKCPERIKKLFPELKMILLLREPVARAFSAWKMHHYVFKTSKKYEHLYDPRTFEQAIEEEIQSGFPIDETFSYLKRGMYADQILNYLNHFDEKQFLILTSDEFKTHPEQTLLRVTNFLNLTPFEQNDSQNQSGFWKNEGIQTNDVLDHKVKNKLQKVFEPHNRNLEKLIKKDILWKY